VALLTTAADRHAAVAPLLLGVGHTAINLISCLPAGSTAANPPHTAVAGGGKGTDRQMDNIPFHRP